MKSTEIVATRLAARHFQRRALGLDRKHPDIAAALRYHGYIQIDPINVCGRMHDLILRNRVCDYKEGDLTRHLHGEDATLPAESRIAFEHHLPDSNNLVALPLAAWPHLLASMQARARRAGAWSGRLTPRERGLVPSVLAEIAVRGPLSSADFEIKGNARRRAWGSSTLVKSILQKLFFHGRLLIARRENNRRIYDLPERVLPSAVLGRQMPTAEESRRWMIHLNLSQRRLVALTQADANCVGDLVRPVRISDAATGVAVPKLYCLASDQEKWEERESAIPDRELLLLAPLDPLIYDRRVTRAIWNFDYTWEVYTPAQKRKRGYYALPVLAGVELVGHVDAKTDREHYKLIVSRQVRRGYATAAAVRKLEAWLGLRKKFYKAPKNVFPNARVNSYK